MKITLIMGAALSAAVLTFSACSGGAEEEGEEAKDGAALAK